MFALKTESIKGRMKQKGAFRKETHVDSHAHRTCQRPHIPFGKNLRESHYGKITIA